MNMKCSKLWGGRLAFLFLEVNPGGLRVIFGLLA